MKRYWQRFLDWLLGPKCPKHGLRPDEYASNFPCWNCWREYLHEEARLQREEKIRQRAAEDAHQIDLMAAAFRRVLDERGIGMESK